ncbi:ABC-type Fe3+ transport system permease component [Gaiella occulta]|uniref:ABC-type Fe3+ transport system permease component n=1 Tax=Gaiella occulta TaxID=1002870 RepID=A0A7M2YUQ5_9ACTN|nr:iron ABC transporter permease [Gaiella occulta]RDI73833.1 ABC-type Fe3+ transport system permease component [Gaiella occulta]
MSRGAGGRRPPLPLALAAGAAVVLLLLPLAYLLIRVASGGGRAVDLLWDTGTLRLAGRTVLLVGGVVAATIAVSVPTAWLVTRTDLPGRRLWSAAAALPLVIPSYVAALCLLGLFGEKGLLQQALGIERLPDPTGYGGALAALTLSTYPYVFLLTRSALRDLDPGQEEAARSLGVGRAGVFVRVTLPSVRPAISLGALLVALYTLSDFGVVSLMRYDALTRAIYLHYRSLFDRTPAAVLSLVLVALTAVALVVERRVRTRGRVHRTSPGAARRAAPVPLGRWKVAALAWCAIVTGAFLALPAFVLGFWLERAIVDDRALELPWAQALSSLAASALAAAWAVAAAVPVAVLALRYPSRGSRTLERLSFAGNALPGLVIALSLVFFAARYAAPVYQTLALLVFAYVTRFFPQALSGVESALHRVDPRVEEAARGLGRGWLSTLVTVTVPLARSGFLAGGALVFLSAMKELPATLLLRPIGFETLATEIWTLTQVGAYSRAALPSLVLIAVSAPVLYLVFADRRPGAHGG